MRFGYIKPTKLYSKKFQLLLSKTAINVDMILEHWPDIIRLAVSLQQRTILPSQILSQLTARHQQNKFAKALQELGRIARTDFMLTWISEPAVRRASQIMLNKGEMSHVITDIMDRTIEGQALRIKGGQFVKAMIVFSNTEDLHPIVTRLREAGCTIPDEVLTHISPLGTRHLIFNGDYIWEAPLREKLDIESSKASKNTL